MIKHLTLSQRLLERADASDEDCRTDDGDIMREADDALKAAAKESALAVERERLRFEGDLDKWMKIIGAGITGFQPEAYALMDLACEELVGARLENAQLRDALKPFADCCPKTDSLWDNDDRWDAHVSVGEMRAARAAVKEKSNA